MLLQEVVIPESKFFLKSEWGPASDDWPAVSFSKQSVGRRIRGVYDPARDFVIYVGTTNPINTPDVGHRSRLLSLVSMDLRAKYKTRDLIPPESWTWSQKEHGDRWMYAFAITHAWTLEKFPTVYDYAPRAYRQLGNPANFGGFVQLDAQEGEAIRSLEMTEVSLKKQAAAIKVEARARFLDAPKELKQEIYRWAAHESQGGLKIRRRQLHGACNVNRSDGPDLKRTPPSFNSPKLRLFWEIVAD
jgi:hypothetical protein